MLHRIVYRVTAAALVALTIACSVTPSGTGADADAASGLADSDDANFWLDAGSVDAGFRDANALDAGLTDAGGGDAECPSTVDMPDGGWGSRTFGSSTCSSTMCNHFR